MSPLPADGVQRPLDSISYRAGRDSPGLILRLRRPSGTTGAEQSMVLQTCELLAGERRLPLAKRSQSKH